MKQKSAIVLILAITILLSACTTTDDNSKVEKESDVKQVVLSADYPVYDTAEDLVGAADFVFSGTVENITYEAIDVSDDGNEQSDVENAIPYTVYEIKVSKVYQGESTDETVYIKCPGGRIGDTVYVLDSANPIIKGETYLFLTKTYSNTYPSLLNVTQALFNMNTSTISDDGDTITLNDVLAVLEEN